MGCAGWVEIFGVERSRNTPVVPHKITLAVARGKRRVVAKTKFFVGRLRSGIFITVVDLPVSFRSLTGTVFKVK